MRRALFVAAALLLALAACGAALSHVMISRNPALAAAAFPLNGAAKSELADLLARAEIARQMATASNPAAISAAGAKPPASAVRLAGEAYRLEPLAIDSLRLLAADLPSGPAQLALLESAHDLSRRSTALSVMLLDRYNRLRRDREGLAVFDEVLRRETVMHGELLTALAASVSRPALLPDHRRLLQARPPWSDQFWRQLAQQPLGLANAAELRLGAAADGLKVSPEIDRLLIASLADNGHHDDAARLAARLFPEAYPPPAGTILVNGDFSQPAERQLPPFGWILTNSGDYGAALQPSRSTLAVNWIGGARGEFAAQLVRLPEGRPLALAVVAAGNTPGAVLGRVGLTVTCAAGGAPRLRATLAELPKTIPAGCRWVWLRMAVASSAGEEGVDLELDRVELR